VGKTTLSICTPPKDQELEGARNIKFRQVQATESIIPYVICVVCIALGGDQGDLVWRGPLPALIIV
jgi:hypothetical protein